MKDFKPHLHLYRLVLFELPISKLSRLIYSSNMSLDYGKLLKMRLACA